jgi:hypothetical protein
MKYVIALVLLISLASSQLRDKTGKCDTNKWSEYTAADCTDATQDALALLYPG